MRPYVCMPGSQLVQLFGRIRCGLDGEAVLQEGTVFKVSKKLTAPPVCSQGLLPIDQDGSSQVSLTPCLFSVRVDSTPLKLEAQSNSSSVALVMEFGQSKRSN